MMNYGTGRIIESSKVRSGMTKSLPVANMPISWQYASGFYSENYATTVPNLHEFGSHQHPCDRFKNSFTHQVDQSLHHSATNSSPSPSCFTRSANLSAGSSRIRNNQEVPPSSFTEHYPQNHNVLFIPQPHISENRKAPMQTLTPTLLPCVDLTYQSDEDLQLEEQMQKALEHPGNILDDDFDTQIDVDGILPSANGQENWQMGYDLIHQLVSSNENPNMHETYGVNQNSHVGTVQPENHQMGWKPLDDLVDIPGPDTANKARMRWTQELHDCFVQAVNDLGGPDRATPKSIQIKMGVGGLTIYHIKSHLQKYRLARHQPEAAREDKRPSCSEGKKRVAAEKECSTPRMPTNESETLFTQLEIQKTLHEQLKVIRALQLRTEENARWLKEFVEDQNKVREAFMQATQLLSPMGTVVVAGPSTQPTASSELLDGSDRRSRKDEILSGHHAEDDVLTIELDAELSPPSHKRVRLETETTCVSILSNDQP